MTQQYLFRFVIAFMMVAVAAFGVVACGGGDDDDDDSSYGDDDSGDDDSDFRDAIPSPDSLTLTLPGEDTSGAKSLGELATLYDSTVDFTRDVNSNILYFLGMIDEITAYEAGTVDGDTATWGPWIPDGLSPVEVEFVMVKESDTEFSYEFYWRPKNTDDEWTAVWWGHVDASLDTERLGVGTFSMDFTAAWELDPTINERGGIDVNYDTITDGKRITVIYDQFCPDQDDADAAGIPCPLDAQYDYVNHADNTGEFEFDYWADVQVDDPDPDLHEYEHAWVNTRWQSDGTGRSDVDITEGDMDEFEMAGHPLESYNASECWGDDFLRDFYEEVATWESLGPADVILEGDEAACAFDQQMPDTN